MYFAKNTNIIKILLKNISYNKDKDCKLYLLLILGQFLKEKNDIIENKNNLEEIYEELKHIIGIKIKIYLILNNYWKM